MKPEPLAKVRGALERIAKYPSLPSDELGYSGCRAVAREALAAFDADGRAEESEIHYRLSDEVRRIDDLIREGKSGSADVRQVPVAWVLPGDDHERDGGWIDARINREGEFTKPLYAAPEPAVNEPEQTIPAWINDALDFEPSKQFGIADMANVGHALMQALPKGYVYSNSPAEIVTDLQNQIADLEAHKPQSVSDNDQIQKARQKLEAALNCHPRAVSTLIEEALAALTAALSEKS